MRSGLVALLMVASPLLYGAEARAEPPWTLEELFSKPWVFGTEARNVAISDDGEYLACAWDSEAESIGDLWVYDVAAGCWSQHTDLWPAREQHLRREFARELRTAREEWEEKHAPADEQADADLVADDQPPEFDEEERVEEFEEELAQTKDEFAGIERIIFARGGHRVLYLFEGRLFSLDLDREGTAPVERLSHEQGFGGLTRIRDSDAVLLTSENDALLWWPAGGSLRQLTSGGWADYDNVDSLAMSSSLRYLAAVRRDYREVRKQRMPELLADDPHTTEHYHVRPQDTPEQVQLLLHDYASPEPWIAEVELPDKPFYHVNHLEWSPTAEHRLLVGVITGDTRTYNAYVVTPPGSDEEEPGIELVYTEEDDCWLNWRRTRVAWDSEGGLLLQSERDGLAGLYRLRPADGTACAGSSGSDGDPAVEGGQDKNPRPSCEPEPLYAGEYEITGFRPLRHSPGVLLRVCSPDPTSQSVVYLDLRDRAVRPLIGGSGIFSWSALSEDETLLAYSTATERRQPDLGIYGLATPRGECKEQAQGEIILSRNPEPWLAWTATWDVRFIKVPGDDGDIPVKLWLPPDWSPEEQRPLLLWAHGAGYAQAVRRDAGFYTLLHPWVAEQHGWLVAEIDYRGSANYGRDWRVDVWGRLGHPETDDLVAVKKHLVEGYGADPGRTALWGWSYGGFLTLMALGLEPGEFPVGVAVAPVTYWENYFYWYATQHLGHPDENPEAYELSSAMEYLESVEDKLLIVHGLRDDNTLFQSVAQYIEEGHKLGVPIDLKLFPADSHGIGSEHHYIRVFEAVVDYCLANWR